MTKLLTATYMSLEKEKAKLRRVVNQFFGFDANTEIGTHRLGELSILLCGGAINSLMTGRSVNDLDFYLQDPSKLEEAKQFLATIFLETPFKTENAITYKRKSTKSRKVWTVQLITRFSGTPAKIFDDFDFTITHGAFNFSADIFELGERFFPDLVARRLVYAGSSKYPICALYRTKKYGARGYTVSGSTLMHIALSIVQLKIHTYKQLKEQLMGIDTMFLQGLLNRFPDKYEDSLPVNYGEFVSDIFAAIDGTEEDFSEDDHFEPEI